MISNLSAYIQFLAAIYVTICIDNLICRRFWSPDYYNLVTTKLSVFANTISSPKRERLEEKIREKEHVLDSRSRKRGAIMLTSCLLLLWYVGFEKPFSPATIIARNIPIATLMLLTFVSLISCKWLSKRWRYTLAACFFIALVFALLVLYVSDLQSNYPYLSYLVYTKRFLTVLILLPIFYQLYVNWLYSKAYIIYLNKNIDEEFKRYTSSKKGLENNNQELVDSTYHPAFTNILLKKMSGDNAMTELNDLLYEHLKACCTPPGPIRILITWWKNKEERGISTDSEHGDIVSGSEEVISPVHNGAEPLLDSVIDEKFLKYKNIKNKPKISDFCKSEQIDEQKFREYYRYKESINKKSR